MKIIFILFILKLLTNLVQSRPYLNTFIFCNKFNCPVSQGICTKNNICICFDGYITIDDDKYGFYQCNYRKKSQTLAFIFEFIIGFGVGHLYLGNMKFALLKLIFCYATAFFICFFPVFIQSIRSKFFRKIAPYIQTAFSVSYCTWQIVDGILIGIGHYKDGNGIDMNEW